MRINEIFYSIQGEGIYAGTPAVFIRFSTCNLSCSFCDTDFTSYTNMSEEEIVNYAKEIGKNSVHVVLTGGEPTLQLTDSLCHKLHNIGKFLQIETNGTGLVPDAVDFITCSPKIEFCINSKLKVQHIDELKVIFNDKNDMTIYENIKAKYYSLQPCDTGDSSKNKTIVKHTIEYCKNNPIWRLSIQTHKILNVK